MFRFTLIFVVLWSIMSFPQNDLSWKVFDDTYLARVDITIDSSSLNWIYNNVQSDSEHYAIFRFRNNHIDETIDSIGFRLRGNTSRFSQKKSFKISFNSFIQGREFYGVDKLNLNGEHNDPSIVRSKLCFEIFDTLGVIASRANHVRVYINNKYYGLYINVEHIDDEFLNKNYPDDTGNLWKCLYPADLKWRGPDPNVYKNLNNNGVPVYELTQNEETGDFSKLVRLIGIINNTPDGALPDSLEDFLDVGEVLEYLAFNIMTGSWDAYWNLANNYYLYHHPFNDQFRIIPYDYDNTFGIGWTSYNWATANPYTDPGVSAGSRPLVEKLFVNDQYRDLYTHFISFYREKVIKLSVWEERINTLRDMIAPAAIEDSFRVKDWGFDVNDFYNSYGTSYSNQHVKKGIKQFLTDRYNSIGTQLNYRNAKPIIYSIDFFPKNPKGTDTITVVASGFSTYGLMEMAVALSIEGVAGTENYTMITDPDNNGKRVRDKDRWIVKIPPLGEGKKASFKIRITDAIQRTMIYPRKDPVRFLTQSTSTQGLYINEFMADNEGAIPDPVGEYDDWLELYNSTNSPILLTGKYLTDKQDNLIKWRFSQPNLYIDPHSYLVIWCDENSGQPGIHTNFKLSAGGEYIGLVAEDGITVQDSITFGQQQGNLSFARIPDGSNNWLFNPPTPGAQNIPQSLENTEVPLKIGLQVFPNPFNPSTKIKYSLKQSGEISLKVFDILGSEVVIIERGFKSAGEYEVIFIAKGLGSGFYYCVLEMSGIRKVSKLLLTK